jgi:phosphoribosylanthranilate isomerase
MRTRIKICGVTTPEDARGVLEAGADSIGLVFTESPRRVTRDEARAIRDAVPDADLIGVFRDEGPEQIEPVARDLGLRAVQVEGWIDRVPWPVADVWHVLRSAALPDVSTLPMIPLRTYLLDAHDAQLPGGTGKRADWEWASVAVRDGIRLVVAGGLAADNVADLVRDVRPYGVDASSRLERAPRRKDLGAVRAFVERVRATDRERPQRS